MVLKSRLASFAAGSLLAMTLVASVHAQTNPGFESGDFTGWNSYGDALVLGANLGTGPAEGKHDAFVASATDGSVNTAVPVGLGVSSAVAESDLALSTGSLAAVGNGSALLTSAISQSIALVAGQTVSFQWDFLTNQTYFDGTNQSIAPDAGNNDFAFFSTSGASAGVSKLADTFYGYAVDGSSPAGFDSGFTVTNVNNPFVSETGFHTFSLTAATTGNYLLGFGVSHAVSGTDNGINSALLIDNIQVSAATPEPASLLALGGLCAGLMRRRRQGAR